jgi:hypothetical protein
MSTASMHVCDVASEAPRVRERPPARVQESQTTEERGAETAARASRGPLSWVRSPDLFFHHTVPVVPSKKTDLKKGGDEWG